MSLRKFTILLLLLTISGFSCHSQKNKMLAGLEDSLRLLSAEIRKSGDDSVRTRLNDRYLATLKGILNSEESFHYSFDSLTTIAKLYSPDKKFRIYNWNLPDNKGGNKYFCLIQTRDEKNVKVIELRDVSDSLTSAENSVLAGNRWYGGLYYRILRNVSGDRVYYTLLGWDGCNSQFYQKLIDVLTFDDKGIPVFGANIFKNYGEGHNTRILFRYSSQSAMLLKYDRQVVQTGRKNWDPKKKSFIIEKKPAWVIVFDQLGPLTEPREGQPVYNVPLGENYDGFLFENGVWNYVRNILAGND
jgi:hypothetical protein